MILPPSYSPSFCPVTRCKAIWDFANCSQESVQDTINHAFPGSTMLAVAHRLETIMEFRPRHRSHKRVR